MKIGRFEIYIFTNFNWLSLLPNIELCVSCKQITFNWFGVYLAFAIEDKFHKRRKTNED